MQINCWICGQSFSVNKNLEYSKCSGCGYTKNNSTQIRGSVNNGRITNRTLRYPSLLTKIQIQKIISYLSSKTILCDIGSGTGEFIYFVQNYANKVFGIEVSKKSVYFSSKILKLNIKSSVKQIRDKIDVFSAWHSLEHIEMNKLRKTLADISSKTKRNGIFIISVPNTDCCASIVFKKDWAFRDNSSHYHEFSETALKTLLMKYKFSAISSLRVGIYSLFDYIQSCCNLFSPYHNYIYFKLKRGDFLVGNRLTRGILDLYHILVLILCAPFGFLFYLIELIFFKRSSVITLVFKKNST